jgi:hypothetical protein
MDFDMKFPAIGVALVLSSLTACTTVDLSQVAIQSEPVQSTPAKQNIVERASAKLTASFREKGWCSGGPQEKTQTATSVLLNGVDAENERDQKTSILMTSIDGLGPDLKLANEQVMQATKAANIYLEMSETNTEFDRELSALETALLSAREAEGRFGSVVTGAEHREQLETLKNSIVMLKTVTDQYGERARLNIAVKSSKSRS